MTPTRRHIHHALLAIAAFALLGTTATPAAAASAEDLDKDAQQTLMASLSIEGTKISRIKR